MTGALKHISRPTLNLRELSNALRRFALTQLFSELEGEASMAAQWAEGGARPPVGRGLSSGDGIPIHEQSLA